MVLNPYDNVEGQWIAGNFHGHSAEHSSCASVPLNEALSRYVELRVQFTAITDHDWVSSLVEAKTRFPELTLLEGFEHSSGENLLFVGSSVPPLYKLTLKEATARADGLLTIACHPQPRPGDPHWSLEKLRRLSSFPDGIEIFNGHYGVPKMLANGCNPRYLEFWDDLLTRGFRVWGFSNDDSHDPADFGNAFNMVLVETATPSEIIQSAKAGRFYGSTGLIARSISGNGREIHISFDTPCDGSFIGPGGKVYAQSHGVEFSYSLGDESYIRFQGKGDEGEIFLQPIWRQYDE